MALSPRSGAGSASPDTTALIQSCSACKTGMNIADSEPLSRAICPECGAEMVVGEVIGHYKLLEIAGRGGMGVVYKAMDQSLDRIVALKVLRKDRLGPEALAELQAEASITASINHPHIVKVFTTGMTEGRFYIEMELVNRGTLDDLIRIQGRVAEAQVLDIAIQVADGLRAAWLAGLIHRDVKPGNLLFSDAHTAKIVDFGLAMLEQHAAEAVGGEIWGTPYYIAPEKLDQQPEDFRSDIYSLGATLFHALAGRPPFEADNASLVALKHLKSQAVSLQAFAPWVSGSTAYIINRTLNKDPDARYQSYDELIEHLEYAKNELTAQGNTPKEKQRIVLEDATQQRGMAILSLSALAIAVLAAGAFFFAQHKRSAPNAAPAAEQSAIAPLLPHTSEFGQAIELLSKGSYSAAATAFHQITTKNSGSGPLLQWALLHEGIAQLMDNREQDSRATFQSLSSHQLAGTTPESIELSNFFSAVANAAESKKPVPATSVRFENRDYQILGLLTIAVKNWQLGYAEEAAPLLRQIRQAKAPASLPWIASLQGAVDPFLDSYTHFKVALDRAHNATDLASRITAAKDLRGADHAFSHLVSEVLEPLDAELAKAAAKLKSLPAPGIYQIINHKTHKALEAVDGNSANLEGRIQQTTPDLSKTNQQWVLYPLGDNIYRISSLLNGKGFDLFRSNPNDGATIGQYPWQAAANQRWIIERRDGDGTYTIASNRNKLCAIEKGAMEDGAGLVQAAPGTDPAQQWEIVRVELPPQIPDGLYKIYSAQSRKVVDVSDKSTKRGAQVWQWPYTEGTNQVWSINRRPDGWYQIIAEHSHQALDLTNGEDNDGVRIEQWDVTASNPQLWKFDFVPDKGWKLHTKASNRVLSVDGSSDEQGALLNVRTFNDTPDQYWLLAPMMK